MIRKLTHVWNWTESKLANALQCATEPTNCISNTNQRCCQLTTRVYRCEKQSFVANAATFRRLPHRPSDPCSQSVRGPVTQYLGRRLFVCTGTSQTQQAPHKDSPHGLLRLDKGLDSGLIELDLCPPEERSRTQREVWELVQVCSPPVRVQQTSRDRHKTDACGEE
ncbi:hypothetical protein WMY93_022852 [Mugilogobius chulae]|uniref:Uncharacterized protein n=1 Tax=Mugilogobius chulae TaxID=88201 RepID=A0AAW0NF47_9GOBI